MIKVKGFDTYFVDKEGNIYSEKKSGLLKMKGWIDTCGYSCIRIRKDGVIYKFKSHRLIALNFIPNPENKPQVNHINGIRTDNRVENLEWCTQSENQKNAHERGVYKKRKPHKSWDKSIYIYLNEYYNNTKQISKNCDLSKKDIENLLYSGQIIKIEKHK